MHEAAKIGDIKTMEVLHELGADHNAINIVSKYFYFNTYYGYSVYFIQRLATLHFY